ncbi:unnamed protein product [Lasius platythorax]|uniref:Uncharacterized protein n=1 Tax=Lasius platythorax TaxID=488582 RepID=A0AAV2NWS9_9HYME
MHVIHSGWRDETIVVALVTLYLDDDTGEGRRKRHLEQLSAHESREQRFSRTRSVRLGWLAKVDHKRTVTFMGIVSHTTATSTFVGQHRQPVLGPTNRNRVSSPSQDAGGGTPPMQNSPA